MPESGQDAGAESAGRLAADGPDASGAEAVAPEPDPVLAASGELARIALEEITPAETIGRQLGVRAEEEHVASLQFECLLPGYPDWFWTVTLARVEGEAPTVLEAELLPGEGSLLAPDWVPWSVRLAEYEAAKAAGEVDEVHSEDDDDEFDDEELDDDLDDDDDDDEELDDDGLDSDDDDDDDHEDVFEVDRQLDQFLDELAGVDDDDDADAGDEEEI